MRVLIIGAGAIGTVYARHFAAGGAEVCFYVRPGRGGRVRRGLPVTALNESRAVGELRCPAVTAVPEGVDVVVLSVPSDALGGAWLGELLGRTGGATILLLSPGLDDRARVLTHAREERLVQGRITAVAWRAPLPGESLEPSLAYWLPPGRAPVWGERAGPIAEVLERGGLPCRVVAKAPPSTGSAVLMPLVASLEASSWSLRELVDGGLLPISARAIREALDVAGAPVWTRLVRPLTLRLLVAIAPRLAPFPLESYLARHFGKLGAQTRLQLDAYIARVREAGGGAGALRVLRARLGGVSGALVDEAGAGRSDLAGWGHAGAQTCTSTSS